MNIVIKQNSNYNESLGAIDLTAPDIVLDGARLPTGMISDGPEFPETVLVLCRQDELSCDIVPILTYLYRQYDLKDAVITLCYPEEPIWEMVGDIPVIGICHLFMEEHDLHPGNLKYITGNFLAPAAYSLWQEENNKTKISSIDLLIHYTHWDHWTHIQKRHNYYETHKRNRHFKYVNLNGAPRMHRTKILNYLYDSNFLDLGLNSCHYTSAKLDVGLRKRLPLRADHLMPNSHHLDQSHLYDNSYFSIVTETTFNHREGGITEKSYKTFYYRHPFIMVGSAGTLAELRRLGFKTFDGLIDESYDNIIDKDDRIQAILAQIHKLCIMSNAELKEWHHSLSDIYDHNQNLLYHWGATRRRNRPRNDNYN